MIQGFGLPLLEAMSFGCPVVCSNTSSIPEVVSDAGEYFEPCDIDSIADTLEKVLFSTDISKKLIAKAKKRIQYFSWDKCSEQTSNVYYSLA